MPDIGDLSLFGEPRLAAGIRRVTGVHGGLAAAVGLQASGLRAEALLSGAELTASLDLLAEAVRRRLPLVLLLHLCGDHRAYHAAAATGAVQLFAAGPSEAADLALIGRRVAEEALMPAVVAVDGDIAAAGAELSIAEIERYLGGAGDTIHSPTPAQEMLFGKHRRRVPRWHDVDRPLLTGVAGDDRAGAAVAAAGRVCFDAHLPELLERSFETFAETTGRRYGALRDHRIRRAKVLLVAQGAAVEAAEAVAEELRAARGPRVGVVGIRALRLLPAEQIAELLRGRRAVAVLESAAGSETPLTVELRSLMAGELRRQLTTAIYGPASTLRAADLAALCRELADKRAEPRSPIYLGLGIAGAEGYPKRQAHLDAVRRDYPGIARLGLRAADVDGAVAEIADADRTTPPVVRRMAPSRTPLADLAGFWARTGGGDASSLIPDPYLASATVPPMAAALTAPAPARDEDMTLPAFDPALCTGCGDCWSACPDGAVGPLPIGPKVLLDFGMRQAARHGRSADKLRMVVSKLADRMKKVVADRSEAGSALGEVLDAAFDPLIDGMKLPDERKAAIRDAYGAVGEELAELPVARTAPFFDSAGDLFTLAIDPDACQGCGLCVAECEPKALAAIEESAERTAASRELWQLHQELPQPTAAVLEAAIDHPEVGPLAGALLARPAREVMTVAASDAGSGEALAARQVLGTLAALRRPLLEEHMAEVEELRSKLAESIHDELSDALPDRDLDALARGLDALDQPDAELAELTERVETAFETERVDVPGTRRLVEAGRELADLAQRLEKGEGGLGRAPFGVVLAGSPAVWGGTYPHNPFAVPATVAANGGGAALARGLLEGQLRQVLEDIRVLRRARAELERAGGRPSRASGRRGHDGDGELDWASLTAEERRRCPPLVLLASEAELGGAALGSTLAAIETELPLKVVALANLGAAAAVGDPALLALTSSRAHVVQTSVADFDHLGTGLTEALAHDGPAFIRILAPRPADLDAESAAGATLDAARAAGDFTLWSSSPDERDGRSLAELLTHPAVEEPPAEPEIEAAPAPDAAAIAALEQQHAAEVANLRAHYEAHIAQLSAGLRTEMARQVHGKLMRLVSGARASARSDQVEPGNGARPEAGE